MIYNDSRSKRRERLNVYVYAGRGWGAPTNFASAVVLLSELQFLFIASSALWGSLSPSAS